MTAPAFSISRRSHCLTSLTVPKLVLEEGAAYFWRAQFIDSEGDVSEWSDYGYFSTETTDADLNANGIPDLQEVGRTADLDKDGVRDSRQPDIKSVKIPGTGVQIGVSIKGCPTALAIEAVESEDPQQSGSVASGKPGSMPFGLINFRIAVAKPGDPAVVKLYFSQAAPASSKWYKYDPIAGKLVRLLGLCEIRSGPFLGHLDPDGRGAGRCRRGCQRRHRRPGGDCGSGGQKSSEVAKIPSNTRSAGSGGISLGGGGGFIETAIDSGMAEIPLTFLNIRLLILLSLMLRARPRALRQGPRRE